MPNTQLIGGKRPRVAQARGNSFDAGKQERFFAELAATCNVRLSARRARVAVATVYKHKAQDAAFRARWAEAIGGAYHNLELMMLERAMNGTVKTVTKADGSVDRTHEYPNAIALTLLRLHRDNAAEAEPEVSEADADEIRARIMRRIGRLRDQMIARGELVERAAEEDRQRRRGLD
ncbi:hypothetical protein HJG53_07090 [Sphingomonas sp. ID1715]|uniref:hypothetical protein n=1 Tax=Sphingomonas sp. ID1715 TaxID=1656898 RepID=UPI001489B542|nr:hypothetical protein [Sphingomonas sp. ID1715]NNM76663.1 hypothetical protein [Sphingomonas sp. ID1715]